LAKVTGWLETQPNVALLYVSYNEVLADPVGQAKQISAFFDGKLDVAAMVEVVDPELYRNRLSDGDLGRHPT
jgi:hypothetical protein